MVGTITIPTTPICIGIQEVPIAGASVWDLDMADLEWVSPTEIPIVHITVMVDITADTTPTMDMVDIMADITPIMVMADVAATVMADTLAMDTPAMVSLMVTVMEGWIADSLMDTQGLPM